MSRVGGKDTKPELIVRSLLHRMGYRFRLHKLDLPGKPDIALPKYRKVVFIHGCFWHGHEGCPRSKRPDANKEFWREKLDKNIVRDRKNMRKINELGWYALVVWTCEVKNTDTLKYKLLTFLEEQAKSM